MALTMVHLLAADRWAQGHPAYRDCPEYYLGAISPDAIHIRDHDDKSHKDYIHLHNWQLARPEEVAAYWREHASPFDIGYGIHVLTDGQWVPRYRERLSGLLRPDGMLNVDIYYHDTWVTDFFLCRTRPELPRILGMIERAAAPEDHPLLTADELAAWRDMTVEMYRGDCPRQGAPQFVTPDYVLTFVEECVGLMDETYRGCFPD